MKESSVIVVILSCVAGCGGSVATIPADEGTDGVATAALTDGRTTTTAIAQGTPLSAYFGGNDVPPARALTNCNLAPGQYDGVPVLFPTEIDPNSFTASSFQIRRNGRVYLAQCATLLPATSSYSASTGYLMYDDEQPSRSFENRTVLLAFDGAALGRNATTGVSIVTDVMSEDGSTTYKDSIAPLVMYGTGPKIGYAEHMNPANVPISDSVVADPSAPVVGTYCPAGTSDAVLIVWQGGVTVNGQELTAADAGKYRMDVELPDGTLLRDVVPDGLGDTNGDQDNNQIVCLVGEGRILKISVPANTVTDPSGYWNPDTSVDVP